MPAPTKIEIIDSILTKIQEQTLAVANTDELSSVISDFINISTEMGYEVELQAELEAFLATVTTNTDTLIAEKVALFTEQINTLIETLESSQTETSIAPTLSGSSTVNENSNLVVTITDYEPTATYTVTLSSGTYTISNGTITMSLGSVTADEAQTLQVTRSDTGKLTSNATTHNFTIVNVAFAPDTDAYVDVSGSEFNATNFPTISNASIVTTANEEGLLSTADNAIFESSIASKSDLDGDWIGVQSGSFVVSNLTNILSSTDETECYIDSSLTDGTEIYLGNFDNFLKLPISGSIFLNPSSSNPFNDGSLVSKYEFNENANDTVGNNDGTPINLTYDLGELGYCGVFNGSSSGVNISKAVLSTQSFSLFFTFTVLKSGINGCIISNRDYYNSKGISILIEGGQLYLQLNGNLNSIYDILMPTPEVGVSHFCLLTRADSGNYLFYLNDELVYTSSVSSDIVFSSNEICSIGYSRDINGNFFNGFIDQIEIYNRALASDEITSLFNTNKTKFIHGQSFTPTFACEVDNVSMQVTLNNQDYQTLVKDSNASFVGTLPDDIKIKETFEANTSFVSGTDLKFKIEHKKQDTKTTAVYSALNELGA
ncbi:LamG-like jellyroll fold domain-containing protein [Sulfurimonas sp.]|uniref:LamG-like jellyroll fold domain-containing protein n=1 Tax=Sulfurimonas sp. TaxID=2022749 RepID=UPI0035693422